MGRACPGRILPGMMAPRLARAAAGLALLLGSACAHSQTTKRLDTPSVPQPPGDSTVPQPPDSQLDSSKIADGADRAALGSPVSPLPTGDSISLGTPIQMTLLSAADSKSLHNGDKVQGTLAAPLKTRSGHTLAQGTRVEATVVSAAPVGTLASFGVLSLQLTRVGGLPIVSDVLDFNGQEGHRDVADSAPAKGTEAVVAAGSTLDFKVMDNSVVPGVVKGIAPAVNAGPGAPTAGQAAQAGLPLRTPAASTAAGQVPVQNGGQRGGNAPGGMQPR